MKTTQRSRHKYITSHLSFLHFAINSDLLSLRTSNYIKRTCCFALYIPERGFQTSYKRVHSLAAHIVALDRHLQLSVLEALFKLQRTRWISGQGKITPVLPSIWRNRIPGICLLSLEHTSFQASLHHPLAKYTNKQYMTLKVVLNNGQISCGAKLRITIPRVMQVLSFPITIQIGTEGITKARSGLFKFTYWRISRCHSRNSTLGDGLSVSNVVITRHNVTTASWKRCLLVVKNPGTQKINAEALVLCEMNAQKLASTQITRCTTKPDRSKPRNPELPLHGGTTLFESSRTQQVSKTFALRDLSLSP